MFSHGNFNFVFKEGTLGDIYVPKNSNCMLVIEGDIHIVANNDAIISADTTALVEYATANDIPYYILKSGIAKPNAITPTNVSGTFNVMDGYLAIVKDETDSSKVYMSKEGALTLPVGSYVIEMMDNTNLYICNGETIEVFVPCKIDFANVSPKIHSVKDKIFIGWKLKSTGEYLTSSTEFAIGDVLEAQYIDCTDEDFGINTEIRTVDGDALCFIVNVNKSFYNALPNAFEYGTISLPNLSTRGRDIYLDEAVVWNWTWDEETRSIFTAKNTGDTPVVNAANLYEDTKENFKYILSITNITEENYDRYYMVRGYIKYVDNNGIERVAYTDHANTSMYYVASVTKNLVNASAIKEKLQDIIDYVEITGKEAYFEARSKVKVYDNGDPNYNIFNYGSLSVRDIVIYSNKNLSVPISIVAMSDPHLQHINLRDLEEASPQTLATYRGRGWTNNGATGSYLNNCIQFAKYADKTIVIGDVWDYLSWGTGEAMQRMLTDKFLPGKLIVTMGNHEQTQLLVPDVSDLKEEMSSDEMDKILKEYWPNDLYYYSEIVTNTAGEEGAIVVSIMSAWNEFNEQVRLGLTRDIEIAKEKGLPILLFMHNPLATNNPSGDLFYAAYNKNSWGSDDSYNTVINMSRYAGGSTCTKQDETTLAVYDMIVQNYDVIKGVFHGHEHVNMYTEIAAKDSNGNYVIDESGDYVVIPQYGLFAISEGGGSLFDITIN